MLHGYRSESANPSTDIAFCNKNLYGLADCELYKFDIGTNENGAPAVTSVHRVDLEEEILCLWCWESHETYIFELHGNPAIAMKFLSTKECCKCQFFRVFELVDSGCIWAEATSLGNHALFLFLQCYMMSHSAIDSMTVMFGKSAFPTRHCQPRTKKGLSALLEREAEIGLRNSAGLRSAENHPPRPRAWA
jgi:hypothetical protein